MLETFVTIMIMSWVILISIGGAFIVYNQTEFLKPHRVFTVALLIRGFIYLLSTFYVAYNYLHNNYNEINGVLSVRKLTSAFIFYFVFSAFPLSVVYQGKISIMRIIQFLSPAVLVTIAYFIICHICGAYPFEKYASLAEVWSDRANPIIVGRMIVYFVFTIYIIYMLYYMWKLEPIYTRYIKQTQSNERLNLSWLRKYFICISIVYFANLTILIYTSSYSVPIYLITACISYSFIIYYVVSCYTFASLDGLKIRFTLLKPIAEIEDYDCGKRAESVKRFEQFETWLNQSKAYTSPNFSLSDVTAQFPTIDTDDINMILMERELKFQSYIRACRINYAAELIEQEKNELRFKELSYKVGFENPASFSRAFKAVKGVSPMDYREMRYEV